LPGAVADFSASYVRGRVWRSACILLLRIGKTPIAVPNQKRKGAQMKNATTVKMMIAAAAFLAVAGTASAQTTVAKIPFAFRANGKVLAAGTYQVRMQVGPGGTPMLTMRQVETNDSVLAVAYTNGDAKLAWQKAGSAVLSFECGTSRCALTDVWMGTYGSPAYRFPKPNLGKDEPRHIAEITMRYSKGD
jgi:hypothetical protein